MQHVDKTLGNVLENLQKTIQKKKKLKPQSIETIQLDIWPESVRAAPNQILRSALFSAIKGSNRKAMERELIASINGFEIRFTGVQLCQTDFSVFEQALHLARHDPLGNQCEFTASSFLEGLGRSKGKYQHEQLKKEFARLMGCGLEVTNKTAQKTYGDNLLRYYRDEITGRYVIQFNPQFKTLFDEGWTTIDWQQRKQLKNKPLAQWLHNFISSHAKIYPMKIETFRELSGSNTKEIRYFNKAFKKALGDLKIIGAINAFYFEKGLAYIDHTSTPSQQKHLSNIR